MKTKEDIEHKKALKQLKKDFKKKEKLDNWRQFEDVSEYYFCKFYDPYRQWSSWIFILFFIYFLIVGNFVLSFVSFGFIHLHLLYNQIWHKLKQIQFFYQNSLYINGGKDDEQTDESK